MATESDDKAKTPFAPSDAEIKQFVDALCKLAVYWEKNIGSYNVSSIMLYEAVKTLKRMIGDERTVLMMFKLIETFDLAVVTPYGTFRTPGS